MSSLSIFGLGTSETVLLILHLVLVALCVWHLTVRSGYGEARMRFVLPLIMFMPGAAVLYLLSAREGTVPPDTIKTGSSSPVYFEHRLGFRDGGRGRRGLAPPPPARVMVSVSFVLNGGGYLSHYRKFQNICPRVCSN